VIERYLASPGPSVLAPARISRRGRVFPRVCIFLFVFFAVGLAIISAQDAASASAKNSPDISAKSSPEQSEVPVLEKGKSYERELSGKNIDHYRVTLQAGEYAGIMVEQRGLDVVVTVADPNGKVLANFDMEMRIRGKEPVALVAESAGDYRIDVMPRYPRAAAGKYAISLTEIRAAVEKDRLVFQVHRLSTDAANLNEAAKYDQALTVAEQALTLGEKNLPPNDPFLGLLFARLADLDRITENRPKSEELFKRAIAIDDVSLGRENPQTAWALDREGVLYNWMDDYLRAAPPLEESLGILERTLGPEHYRVMMCLVDLSLLYQNRHDNQRALQVLLRAQAISEKAAEHEDFSAIAIVNNLANLYRELKDYDRAAPMFEEVLQRVEKKYGPDYPRLVQPLMNLSIIARRKKDYARSLDYLLRAEEIQKKAFGPDNSGLARVLITIGNTYRAEEEYPKALDFYRQAREILKKSAGPYDVLMQLTYVNAATVYSAMGDIPHALEEQAHVESMTEDSIKLNVAIGSERQKLDYLDDVTELTDRAISMSTSLAAGDQASGNMAALVLLQRKGRVLDAMSQNMETLRQQLTPQNQTLLDELNKITTQLAKLALAGPGKTPADDYQKQLAALEMQKEDLEAKISGVSAEFRAQAQSVTLAAVQSAIPKNSALIEFATYRPFEPKRAEDDDAYGEPHYIAYVLTGHGDVQWKDLGLAKPIDDSVAEFRKALRDPESRAVQRVSRALDEKIMQPVRPLAGDATQLLISPDGQLNLIPFEALLDENEKFLLEQYSVTYLSTGRDLLRMAASRPNKSAPVIVADPLFGEPGTEVASAAAPKSKTTARRSVTIAGDLSKVYFAPLEGTALEARTIKTLFPESTVLTGSRATQSAVMQVNAPSILHIATHGFFLTNPEKAPAHESADVRAAKTRAAQITKAPIAIENPLLRSGLALAGANLRKGNTEKGILTALEASNLNLWGTKLVTLSACDTGVGDVRDGEGVYGLRRAFVLAGAESVVMSLWPVSDYVTREMMSSYYAGLKKGLGRGEALRQTKLAMLKRKERRHPFYWASFIQSGEWANLDGKRE
jgi:CHAT domain-containing protein